VSGGRPEHLRAAIDAYRSGLELETDPMWHGINLVALAKRAERDGVEIDAGFDVDALTDRVLSLARGNDPELRQVWEFGTEIEVLLAMGTEESLSEALTAAERLAGSQNATAFALGSLRRQLTEIWQLDPTNPVMLAIDDRQLQLGAGAKVELPESAMQLEKIFGTALPIGYANLMTGLRCAESVCKMTDPSGEPWGTGFLIAGDLIHPDLGPGRVLVTNAHVVSPDTGVGKLVPAEAVAVFDVTSDESGEPLRLTGLEAIWTSPPGRSDVTFLRFVGLPSIPQPLTVAPVPPTVSEGAFVYVIGHPAGGGLKFSIRGNDLLAYDATMSKIHYTAPTEGGSSGSPVFNQAWQLVAVHHAGDSKMRRLDDPTQTYKANEGITLSAIRQEFAASRP
jgi:V8-like Glu-specific endopeptidase